MRSMQALQINSDNKGILIIISRKQLQSPRACRARVRDDTDPSSNHELAGQMAAKSPSRNVNTIFISSNTDSLESVCILKIEIYVYPDFLFVHVYLCTSRTCRYLLPFRVTFSSIWSSVNFFGFGQSRSIICKGVQMGNLFFQFNWYSHLRGNFW